MNKKYWRFLAIALVFITIPFLIKSTPSNKKTGETYIIKALKTPAKLYFAGEPVPLNIVDVKERLDREFLVNTYWQSNGLLLIKRAHKYFPIIEPILAKYNIPSDFKYLAIIESGLQNITSPVGAEGIWQLMPETAKEFGLEVNKNVDERYHLEKATKVACLYLQKAKQKFGTWTAAAAAYNIGIHGFSKRLEEQQVNTYYDVLLPDETARYVPRIVAVKEILKKPYDYGFVYEKSDLYKMPNYKSITIDTVIGNIASFAKQLNTNYKELKILNPWLRENKLNNRTRRSYVLKIAK